MGRKLLLSMMLLSAWTFQAQDAGNNCPVVNDVTQEFCESQGTGNFFYRPAVQHLEATDSGDGIVWYDTAVSTEPLSPDELLVNGEDYFAGNTSGTCEERAMVTVNLIDSPNAGGTTFYEISIDAEPFNILDIYEPSILGAPEAGGTVIPALASGTTVFNPAVDVSGQYRYEVASSTSCPDDFSYIYITVNPDPLPPAGDPEENCPVVEEAIQVFCESQGTGNDFYRPSVSHLVASANGDEIAWFDTPTSTEPLAWDEILVNGEDYYVANVSGNCTQRVRVDCVVNDSPSAGSTTFVTFCSNAAPVDLLNYINPSIIGEADPGGDIVPPLNSGSTIFDPSMDAGGQYEYHVSSSNDSCADDLAVVYITVNDAVSAGNDITLNLTTADFPVDLLTALGVPEGTSASVTPALNSGNSLFDPSIDSAGKYTVTVFNDEGCEDDSAVVTVNVSNQGDEVQNCPIVEFTTQSFCESEGSGNNFYRPAVAHLAAIENGDGIVWYDTAVSTEPLSADEILVDGGDYYAGNASNTCTERQRVEVVITDSPNAGGTTFIEVNASDAAFDILNFYEPSILGAPDAGGTVNPPLASGTTIFDPAQDAGGQYAYTVASSTSCPDDVSYVYITVVEEQTSASADPEAQKVAMYPNPSKGALNVSMADGVTPISVRIFDLNGNTVKSMNLDSQLQLQNLDISSLRPSLYFAEIVTDQGKFVKRIIKN